MGNRFHPPGWEPLFDKKGKRIKKKEGKYEITGTKYF